MKWLVLLLPMLALVGCGSKITSEIEPNLRQRIGEPAGSQAEKARAEEAQAEAEGEAEGEGEEEEGGARCGVERWSVKTLTDSNAAKIDFSPRNSSVDALRSLSVPGKIGKQLPRQRPYEYRVYRVKAQLVAAKQEEDSDIHLVIAQPGKSSHTMIVEFPSKSCVGKVRRKQMARARTDFLGSCPKIGTSRFKLLRGNVTVSGVAFFDVIHGQRGVAPNGIELHPVLSFSGRCQKA